MSLHEPVWKRQTHYAEHSKSKSKRVLKTIPLYKIFFFFYFAEVGGGTEAYDGFGRREVSADVKLGAQMANPDGVASRASN